MKTRTEAAGILLAAGWSPIEVQSILGNLPGLPGSDGHLTDSPWWIWVEKDWYTGGTPLIEEWETWVAQGQLV